MTPTPAQIEAAKREFGYAYEGIPGHVISAALTAAAEVGGPTGNALVTVMADRRCLSNGCQYADAIERCAQALDDRAKMHSNPDIIEIVKGDAAAIRALKDKP